jgi:anaerobic magnesium-protoporphyrin IX monomethyl ester cyclase
MTPIQTLNRRGVLLLIPPGFEHSFSPMAFMFLAGYLEFSGIPVAILDASVERMSFKETIREIERINPAILGISSTSPEYRYNSNFVQIVKKIYPHLTTVAGGYHPTLFPEEVLAEQHFDFAVMGEGEVTFKELCSALLTEKESLGSIPGIAYRNNGALHRNIPRPPLRNLDEIPFPARHLVDMSKYQDYWRMRKRKPVGFMFTSRGCPYSCIYCSQAVFGHKFRMDSPEKMMEEIRYLQSQYGVREIYFRDDNFTTNEDRILELCDRIISGKLDLSWYCLGHVNTVNRKMLRLMKQAGCWHIGYGVESGNQDVLKVIRKSIQLEKAKEVFQISKEEGISTLAFFQIGNYVDTYETVMDTIAFSKSLDADYLVVAITTPFLGTELYDMAKRDGLLLEDTPSQVRYKFAFNDRAKVPMVTRHLSRSDLIRLHRKAYIEFYMRPSQVFRYLRQPGLLLPFLRHQIDWRVKLHRKSVEKEMDAMKTQLGLE